jgi:ankyrin repeat protein
MDEKILIRDLRWIYPNKDELNFLSNYFYATLRSKLSIKREIKEMFDQWRARINILKFLVNPKTILHKICLHCRDDLILEDLRLLGADINGKDNYNFTPLMYSMQDIYSDGKWLDNRCIYKLANVKSLDVNARNVDRSTALMMAAIRNPNRLRVLLSNENIDVNAKNDLGYTALINAAALGKTENVDLLCKTKDININDKDKTGMTALDWACKGCHTECAEKIAEKITIRKQTYQNKKKEEKIRRKNKRIKKSQYMYR